MLQAPLFVAADGVTLWTESFGERSGMPLLLIMGAMNQGVFWPRALCERLTGAGCFVIRYDHRDTGMSSVVDYDRHPYTLVEMSADALAILDSYDIAGAVLIGMSMGGYIAQILAAEHPERVRGLVLLSTTADHRPYMAATMGQDASHFALPPPAPRYLSFVGWAGQHPPTNAEEDVELRLKGWRATHGGTLPFPEEEMRSLILEAAARTRDAGAPFHHAPAVASSPERSGLLRRIAAPTLVIHGVDDPCLPLPHGRHLADAIPGARLLTLDMGHMLHPALCPMVADAVIDLLDSRRDRT